MPTITQLRYVLAVAHHRHFGRAAEAAAVSQPTLSSQIQKVESELGFMLFDRQAKPLEVTVPGQRIVQLAQDVIDAHAQLLREAEQAGDTLRGTFSVAIIPTLAPYVLPWFVGDFAAQYPGVVLDMREMQTDDILESIHKRRLDAAILATPLGESTLEERVLFYDPFYLYGHVDEPLLSSDAIEVSDVDVGRLWLLEDGHCFRAQVLNVCGAHKREVLSSLRFSGGSFETLRHMINATEGVTLIPETFAQTLSATERKRQVRSFRSKIPTREVSLLHHGQTWKRAFVDALQATIQGSLPRCFTAKLDEQEVQPVLS